MLRSAECSVALMTDDIEFGADRTLRVMVRRQDRSLRNSTYWFHLASVGAVGGRVACVVRRQHRAAVPLHLPRQGEQLVAHNDQGEAHRQGGGLGRGPAARRSGGVLQPPTQDRRGAEITARRLRYKLPSSAPTGGCGPTCWRDIWSMPNTMYRRRDEVTHRGTAQELHVSGCQLDLGTRRACANQTSTNAAKPAMAGVRRG
jgi:hypothetical protein